MCAHEPGVAVPDAVREESPRLAPDHSHPEPASHVQGLYGEIHQAAEAEFSGRTVPSSLYAAAGRAAPVNPCYGLMAPMHAGVADHPRSAPSRHPDPLHHAAAPQATSGPSELAEIYALLVPHAAASRPRTATSSRAWLQPRTERDDAVARLSACMTTGAFLVRQSQSAAGTFVLSVLFDGATMGDEGDRRKDGVCDRLKHEGTMEGRRVRRLRRVVLRELGSRSP